MIFPWGNNKIKSIKKWKDSRKEETRHLASLDWDVRCSSILNAFTVFGLVSYTLFIEGGLKWNDIHSKSNIAILAMRMCGGYFITDFIVVVKCRNYYPGVSDYIIHHIVALTAFLLADSGSGKYCYIQFFTQWNTITDCNLQCFFACKQVNVLFSPGLVCKCPTSVRVINTIR